MDSFRRAALARASATGWEVVCRLGLPSHICGRPPTMSSPSRPTNSRRVGDIRISWSIETMRVGGFKRRVIVEHFDLLFAQPGTEQAVRLRDSSAALRRQAWIRHRLLARSRYRPAAPG